MDSKKISLEVFSERLKCLIRDSQKNQCVVAAEMKISSAALSKYINGISEPGISMLLKAAKYFDVSLDYLLGISPCKSYDVDVQGMGHILGVTEEAISNMLAEDVFDDEARAEFHDFQTSFLENKNYHEFLALLHRYVECLLQGGYKRNTDFAAFRLNQCVMVFAQSLAEQYENCQNDESLMQQNDEITSLFREKLKYLH